MGKEITEEPAADSQKDLPNTCTTQESDTTKSANSNESDNEPSCSANVLFESCDGGVEKARSQTKLIQASKEECQFPKATSSTDSSSTSTTKDSLTSDIGSLLGETLTADGIKNVVEQLSTGEKYTLLVNHFIPDENFNFPSTFINRFKRRFQPHWVKEFPWMVYSKARDGVFCKYCSLLVSPTKRKACGGFVNRPQTNWNKTVVAAREHQQHEYHMDALAAGKALIHTVENPKHAVDNLIDNQRLQNITENQHILECMVEAVLYCAKQCIGLRGDIEKVDSPGNPGNFIAYLKGLAKHDEILKAHLFTPKNPKATYVSPITQNELIDIMGNQIRQEILEEVKEAQFFTILADEVTVHNKTYMPLVLRFVDKNQNIREEFVKFSLLRRITGKAIAQQILTDLVEDLGLETSNLRGQGYDGASNMSSDTKGVQGIIRAIAPLALYQHCAGHCLNLVLVNSSKESDVRKVLDNLSQVCLFFKSSPKRMNTLLDVVEKEVPVSDALSSLWRELTGMSTVVCTVRTLMVLGTEKTHPGRMDSWQPSLTLGSL